MTFYVAMIGSNYIALAELLEKNTLVVLKM